MVGFGFASSSFPLGTSFLLSDFEFVVPFLYCQLLALCFHSFLKYQFEFVR
jgi:hypothetical protein